MRSEFRAAFPFESSAPGCRGKGSSCQFGRRIIFRLRRLLYPSPCFRHRGQQRLDFGEDRVVPPDVGLQQAQRHVLVHIGQTSTDGPPGLVVQRSFQLNQDIRGFGDGFPACRDVFLRKVFARVAHRIDRSLVQEANQFERVRRHDATFQISFFPHHSVEAPLTWFIGNSAPIRRTVSEGIWSIVSPVFRFTILIITRCVTSSRVNCSCRFSPNSSDLLSAWTAETIWRVAASCCDLGVGSTGTIRLVPDNGLISTALLLPPPVNLTLGGASLQRISVVAACFSRVFSCNFT